MRRTGKLIALILTLALCLSMAAPAFADNSEDNVYKDYTNVFVHGLFGWGQYDGVNSVLPYWGMTSGNMLSYLSDKGYDVVAASIGPISSCWDRCCELFAQLTGTRTDYGTVHSTQKNAEFQAEGINISHERYGRDYTGNALISGWGPEYDENGVPTGQWYNTKINLIGHSFGGPTIVNFLRLLVEGDEAERSYAQAMYGADWKQYCSPLFWGNENGARLVNSLTSLAGVLNGTTFIDSCDDSTEIICSMMLALGNVLGETNFNKLYDFQLEQFGITKSENPDYDYYMDIFRSTRFLDGYDNAIYDLSITGCNELKYGWKCYDDVFYFAYPGCATFESVLTGNQVPTAGMWPLFNAFGTFMGAYVNENEVVTDVNGDYYTVITRDWLPNDGLVNTVSAGYVFGCPHKDYDKKVEPGIWITMPTYGFDHMDFCGGIADVTQNSWQTKAYFDEIMNNIVSTYSYNEAESRRLAAPTLTAENIKYSSAVRLKWNAVEGATGYKIYRAYSRNGAYSLIRTTSATSLTDVTTVLGLNYYYRIVAVNSKDATVTSDYSDVVNLKVIYLK